MALKVDRACVKNEAVDFEPLAITTMHRGDCRQIIRSTQLYSINTSLYHLIVKGRPNKNRFLEISSKSVYPPKGFCEIWENER